MTESRTVFEGFFSRQFATRARAIVNGYVHAVCRAYQISGFGNLSGKVVAEFSYDDVGYDCVVDIKVLTAAGAGTIFNITVFRTGGILFQNPIAEDVRSRSTYFESLFVLCFIAGRITIETTAIINCGRGTSCGGLKINNVDDLSRIIVTELR